MFKPKLPFKAERVCFLRNGDKFFKGVTLTVSFSRYNNFNRLLDDVTSALQNHVVLRSAITSFYRLNGVRVSSLNGFVEGEIIICCCKYEKLEMLEYSVTPEFERWLIWTRCKACNTSSGRGVRFLCRCVTCRSLDC